MRRLVLFIVHLCALVLIGVLVLRLNAPRPAQPPTENTARPAPTVSPVLPTLPSAQATPTVAPQNTPTATPGPQTGATATPGRQVTPSPGPGGARPDEAAFLEQLRTQAPPQRDLADLARRLKGAMPLATPATNSQTRLVGSKSTFWVTDMQTMAHFTVTATLRHSSAHLYM